ncbi:MAG: hypothetical protein LBQ66_15770 [Planctomycetaceae bacterium]|nr:hypothetical protein [Planctomycetaceae bacterium]
MTATRRGGGCDKVVVWRYDLFGMICKVIVLVIVFALYLSGCSTARIFDSNNVTGNLQLISNSPVSNPISIPSCDHEFLWEVLASSFDSHFETEREMPVRFYDNVLTEGRLDGKPKIGASVFEPWHADSVGCKERFDCTLQTIRRRAMLRVIPQVGGYQIEMFVYKELEDNLRPIQSAISTANLRFKDDTEPFTNRIDVDQSMAGWIMIGRDTAMEQRLLKEIMYRIEHPAGIIRKSKAPTRG